MDRSDEQAGVVIIEPGDGVAEVDGGAGGEAGRQLENVAFAGGAGEVAAGEGGDGGFPVDGGDRGAATGAAGDEPGREVVAVQEGSVADQQGDASLNWAEAGGAGAERCSKVIDVHEDLRVLSGWRR